MKYFLRAKIVPVRNEARIKANKWYCAIPIRNSFCGYYVTIEHGMQIEVHAPESAHLDGASWEVKTED